MSKRKFHHVDEGELEDLHSSAMSDATKRTDKMFEKALCDFETAVDVELKSLPPKELCAQLCRFVASYRLTDGSQPKKNTLNSLQYALIRICGRWKPAVLLKNNPDYDPLMTTITALNKKAKREGRATVESHPAIPEEDLLKIKEYFCSPDVRRNPAKLQMAVWFYLQFSLCRRGNEGQVDMTRETFKIVEVEGRRAITQVKSLITKTNQTGEHNDPSGFVFATGQTDCPVALFELLLSKLHPEVDRLWQRPKGKVDDVNDAVWFERSPVGKNSLSSMAKRITTNAGCSKVYTNHCIRSTAITAGANAGLSDRQIIAVSGHKSLNSLVTYGKMNAESVRSRALVADKLQAALAGQTQPTTGPQVEEPPDDDAPSTSHFVAHRTLASPIKPSDEPGAGSVLMGANIGSIGSVTININK